MCSARTVPPGKAARDLGVRYAVTGSVRKAGPRIRVTIQLSTASDERTVWGEQYNRQLDDMFDLQQEITEVIVSAVALNITASERERLGQLAPSDLRAYGYVLQGQQHIFATPGRTTPAPAFFTRRSSSTRAMPGRWPRSREPSISTGATTGPSSATGPRQGSGPRLAAVEIDPLDARGFGELGFAHLYRKEHDAAISAYRRALSLNPNDADLMSDFADALAHCGQSEEAIEAAAQGDAAQSVLPRRVPLASRRGLLQSEALRGRHSSRLRHAEPAEGRRLLAASYAQLGRTGRPAPCGESARGASRFQPRPLGQDQPDRQSDATLHFIEGLRKAGL
jgi:adenylate cyclase